MGLYDDDNVEEYDEEEEVEESEEEEEPVGKAIASVNKRSLKERVTKIPKESNFEFPNWLRQSLIILVIVIIIAIIGYGIFASVKPSLLSTKISPNPSYLVDGYSNTTLILSVKNIYDYDLKNLELTIAPKDKLAIAAIPSEIKKIPILGANEKREFEYELSTIGNINPGEYAISITLKTQEEIIEKSIIWEITNRR